MKASKLTARGLAYVVRAVGRKIAKAHRAKQTPHGKQTVKNDRPVLHRGGAEAGGKAGKPGLAAAADKRRTFVRHSSTREREREREEGRPAPAVFGKYQNVFLTDSELAELKEEKSYIVRQGMTMQEVVDLLREEHGWSDSVSNLSNKLQRESLRYVEAVQLADALGYEIVWQRRK